MTSAVSDGANPREAIIGLLRGQIACPLISCLGQLGWLERIMQGPFDLDSFGPGIDPKTLRSVMTYLTSIRLVSAQGDTTFTTTPLGAKVFRRYGAFCILHSYEDYLVRLRSLLVPDGSPRPRVDRLRNVVGSGALHDRKFFVPALELLGSEPYELIADVGCGNGQFLLGCLNRFPRASVVAIDLSAIAVEETVNRIGRASAETAITGVVADGADVAEWSAHLQPAGQRARRALVSLWFLVHEISQGDVRVVVDFFRTLHAHCPDATVLMGEVVRMPEDLLADNRSQSLLPELTLLHDLSGQGLLSWPQWQSVLREIPYAITRQRQFDVLVGPDGVSQPSSFVWCLAAK